MANDTVLIDSDYYPLGSTEVNASCTSGCYSANIRGARFPLTKDQKDDA